MYALVLMSEYPSKPHSRLQTGMCNNPEPVGTKSTTATPTEVNYNRVHVFNSLPHVAPAIPVASTALLRNDASEK